MKQEGDFERLLAALKEDNRKDVESYASGALIDNQGRPDFQMHRKLERECGATVRKGESDSFGWLSGIINYQGKEYIFG